MTIVMLTLGGGSKTLQDVESIRESNDEKNELEVAFYNPKIDTMRIEKKKVLMCQITPH